VDNQRKKTIFSEFGIILKRNKYNGRISRRTKVGKKKIFTLVDMVGHSYFFPKQAVLPMFSMRPPSWHNNVDLHFSFLARKKGWNLFVPTVTNKDQLPVSKEIQLPISNNERAMFRRPNHKLNRNEYVKWAIKNKIIKRVI